MRKQCAVLAFVLFGMMLVLPPVQASSRSDVLKGVQQVEDGYNQFNARKVASAYTMDADWQNPFGVHLVGKSQIQAFLTRMFARPGFRSGKNTSTLRTTIQFIRPDVAVAHSFETSAGQIDDSTGQKMAPRKSHYLEVLVKQHGHWLIVSDMIMDEK